MFRRRRHDPRDQDGKPADREPTRDSTSDDEKPYIGYRETILGIPDNERKQFQRNNSKSSRGVASKNDEKKDSSASMSSKPTDMADESTLRGSTASGQGSPTRRASHDGDFADEQEDQMDPVKLSSVSAMRIQKWLPELPPPTLSRGPPRLSREPRSHSRAARSPFNRGGKRRRRDVVVEETASSTTSTSTTSTTKGSKMSLAEIHDRLTKPDPVVVDADDTLLTTRVPAPHASEETSRWSATTHSSVFTARSSRSSGTAYMSSLRPPPLRARGAAAPSPAGGSMDPLRENETSTPDQPIKSPPPAPLSSHPVVIMVSSPPTPAVPDLEPAPVEEKGKGKEEDMAPEHAIGVAV